MSTIPLGNFYTFPKIVFISKVQLLNLLDRVQRSLAALATIQCGHHTGFPPSVTSPGCRSVVVAAAVIGSHGVAVGHHRAAVGDRTTVGDRAAVDGAPVDAVAPLLPLPVPSARRGIGQEDAGQNQDQGQGKTHGELVRDIFPPDLEKRSF